jgi:hypothetical protein
MCCNWREAENRDEKFLMKGTQVRIKEGKSLGNKFMRTFMAYYWHISMEIRQWLCGTAHTQAEKCRTGECVCVLVGERGGR